MVTETALLPHLMEAIYSLLITNIFVIPNSAYQQSTAAWNTLPPSFVNIYLDTEKPRYFCARPGATAEAIVLFGSCQA
jgi:hypothetical protein